MIEKVSLASVNNNTPKRDNNMQKKSIIPWWVG